MLDEIPFPYPDRRKDSGGRVRRLAGPRPDSPHLGSGQALRSRQSHAAYGQLIAESKRWRPLPTSAQSKHGVRHGPVPVLQCQPLPPFGFLLPSSPSIICTSAANGNCASSAQRLPAFAESQQLIWNAPCSSACVRLRSDLAGQAAPASDAREPGLLQQELDISAAVFRPAASRVDPPDAPAARAIRSDYQSALVNERTAR